MTLTAPERADIAEAAEKLEQVARWQENNDAIIGPSVRSYRAIATKLRAIAARVEEEGHTLQLGRLWQHKVRGTKYRKVGAAEVQTSTPIEEGDVVEVYLSVIDGRLWVRPTDEFNDGRFEVVPTPPEQER